MYSRMTKNIDIKYYDCDKHILTPIAKITQQFNMEIEVCVTLK